ncbi:NHL repeat-containing protein [Sandaracinus amylolyticus]|uniref:NHL repeat-containing protein n=1 Tax=Sandaracinus amylolyticus TaxID=927083 RepID=UPI001F48358D|nr:NHL repeat-containing protein [Sandaracinus amylolyticus]UJR79690.1 NHL repeat domain protein [Sandaracinus amylolyticus]
MIRRTFFRAVLSSGAAPLLLSSVGCAGEPSARVSSGPSGRIDGLGRVLEVDRFARTVRVRDERGAELAVGTFLDPVDAVGLDDGTIVVADTARGIVELDAALHERRVVRAAGERDGLHRPAALIDDGARGLLIADGYAHRVIGLSLGGAVTASYGAPRGSDRPLNGPADLAVDALDHIHVVDAGNARVRIFARSGAVIADYDAGGAMRVPRSIAITPEGRVYVADAVASAVFALDLEGRLLETITMRDAIPGEVRASIDGVAIVPLAA